MRGPPPNAIHCLYLSLCPTRGPPPNPIHCMSPYPTRGPPPNPIHSLYLSLCPIRSPPPNPIHCLCLSLCPIRSPLPNPIHSYTVCICHFVQSGAHHQSLTLFVSVTLSTCILRLKIHPGIIQSESSWLIIVQGGARFEYLICWLTSEMQLHSSLNSCDFICKYMWISAYHIVLYYIIGYEVQL